MPIYELTEETIRPIPASTFRDAEVLERQQLQRAIRERIEVISPDTLVIAEEFGEWEDSRRRIDLLGIDKNANLIVIELKRTEDGGHMELQAIRYAAMVSAMTFQHVVTVHQRYLKSIGQDTDASRNLLEFLEWEEPDEDAFAQEVRIVLAAAAFSRELTTAVLWLNDRGLDIRCVRMRPYSDNGRILLDVQQVIPIPEAEQYQVRLREKSQSERASRKTGRDLTKFDVTIDGHVHNALSKREAAYVVARHFVDAGVSPEEIVNGVRFKTGAFTSVPGQIDDEEQFRRLCAEEAEARGKRFDYRRWYTAPDRLMVHDGRTYALTKMWGSKTALWIQELRAAFPEIEVTVEPREQ